MSYEISFGREADANIDNLDKADQKLVIAGIEAQLSHEPGIATRNRKSLRSNKLAEWELRVGRFRIFYDIDVDAKSVTVVAIGIKDRDKLTIGGKAFKL